MWLGDYVVQRRKEFDGSKSSEARHTAAPAGRHAELQLKAIQLFVASSFFVYFMLSLVGWAIRETSKNLEVEDRRALTSQVANLGQALEGFGRGHTSTIQSLESRLSARLEELVKMDPKGEDLKIEWMRSDYEGKILALRTQLSQGQKEVRAIRKEARDSIEKQKLDALRMVDALDVRVKDLVRSSARELTENLEGAVTRCFSDAKGQELKVMVAQQIEGLRMRLSLGEAEIQAIRHAGLDSLAKQEADAQRMVDALEEWFKELLSQRLDSRLSACCEEIASKLDLKWQC